LNKNIQATTSLTITEAHEGLEEGVWFASDQLIGLVIEDV